ncbi:kinase-like domain-containing protein [Mycena polygramma]|nr:kinase-like domain-containing protein [Mycena polygramma]
MVDHFESATTLDLVFELISGDDLYARVLVRKFDENSVKHIARQICDTMARLHGKNIVHRDLKPQNILLGDNLTVIIIDFGCSKSGVTSVTRMTSLLGTLGCIAPEVEKARIYYRNADVYSFAMCLLCLMLSGRPVEIKGVLAIRPPVTLKELDPYIEKCASLDAQDLLYKTLAPAESRISFKEALDHPFFSSSETELAAPSNLGRVIERTSSLTLREDEKGSHRLQCKGPATVRSNSQRSVGEVERENQKGCQRPEKTKPVFQSNSKRSFDEVEEDTKSTAVADRKRSRLRMEDSAQAVHDEAS